MTFDFFNAVIIGKMQIIVARIDFLTIFASRSRQRFVYGRFGGLHKIHRGVEQLAARWAHNPKVAGSSPAPATKRVRIKFPALFFVSPPNAND